MLRDQQPIEVLIAEDNRDLCAALCELIVAQSDMTVAGVVSRVPELLEIVTGTTAHVLILDLDLGGQSSIPALQAFRAAHPRRAIVVYSGYDPGSLGPVFASVGPCDYVTKTGDAQELLDAIRRGAQKAAGAGT
jgi:DNA-binding NarL/FixJ family response regulator